MWAKQAPSEGGVHRHLAVMLQTVLPDADIPRSPQVQTRQVAPFYSEVCIYISVDTFNNFDCLALAFRLGNHEMREMRDISDQLYTRIAAGPVFLGNPDTWPAPTAPITENACYSTAAAALDGLALALKSPSVLDLIEALRSKDEGHLKRVFNNNRTALMTKKEGKFRV